MHWSFRNCNEAFRSVVRRFADYGPGDPLISKSTSRVGDVLYIQEPVTITYTHPRERVLFNQARDCNPFMHVYEALWMLAGRNDISPVAYYAANYAKQVQDGDSPYANGAYGYRWRHHRKIVHTHTDPMGRPQYSWETIDQLKLIVEQLKAKPDSRRCVLQMWNVEDDLLKIDTSKDVCCNTHAYFSLRPKFYQDSPMPGVTRQALIYYLDMTVCNRSNDLIWGALGANVVHFSFLQEYLAACIGCEVGVYNQFTNNLHVYTDRFEPEKWLADRTVDEYSQTDYAGQHYKGIPLKPFPLIKDPATFDRECAEFVEQNSSLKMVTDNQYVHHWTEPFLECVAQPMCYAFHFHKSRDYDEAMFWTDRIKADDWRIASTNWLLKRRANYEARTNEA